MYELVYYLFHRLFHYCLMGGAMLFLMVLPCIPVFLFLRRKVKAEKLISVFLLCGCVLVILFVTVLDMFLFCFLDGSFDSFSRRSLNLVPFAFLTEEWSMGEREKFVQVFANILMFVPYGFLLPLVIKRARSFGNALLYISLFSFGIEFVQFFIGRAADIDDFILNVTGGVMGYFLFKMIKTIYLKCAEAGMKRKGEEHGKRIKQAGETKHEEEKSGGNFRRLFHGI